MKVLQIIADGNPGGGTTFVLEMLKSLQSPVLISQKNSFVVETTKKLKIPTYSLDFFTSRLDFRLPFKLAKLIKSINPDFIHVHGNRAAFFLSFCKIQVPTLYTIHGLHGLYNGNLLGKWGERQAIRSANRLVFVSNWEQHLAIKHRLVSKQNHQVILNGISLEDLPQRKLSHPKLLGFIGRLTQPKDPLFMIEVMKILGPQGYHLKMIGGGELETQLKDIPYITVTGKLSKEKALQALSEVAKVIIPSKWEAFGLALIEAMAMGIPVIASKIPPFEEIIVSEKTGVLIEKKDPKHYAEAVVKGADYSKAAKKHAWENFEWNRCFDQYQSIFSELKRKNR